MGRKIVHYLIYLAVRSLVALIQALPIETCASLAKNLARVAYDWLRIRRQLTDDNLRHAYPELSDAQRQGIARKMWFNLILMICEIAHARRKIHETNWRQYITLRDRRTIVSYLLDRRPVVVVSGHYGTFEIGGYLVGLLGMPTYTIARALDNPYLDEYLNEFRGVKGQTILPKQGSAGDVDAVLESGGRLLLLADQHAGPKGCWVNFFNRPASCHKAVALFTLISGAPLSLVFCRRKEGPMRFEIGSGGVADPQIGGDHLASVTDLTQWYSTQLENVIREAPEGYWWLHDRWKAKPKRKKAKAEPVRADESHDCPPPHAAEEPAAATATAANPGLMGWLAGQEAEEEGGEL